MNKNIMVISAIAITGMMLIAGFMYMSDQERDIWHKIDFDDILMYSNIFSSTLDVSVRNGQITLFDNLHQGRMIRLPEFHKFHKVPCEIVITGSDYTFTQSVTSADTTISIPHFSWVNITVVNANETWSANVAGDYNIYSSTVTGTAQINITANNGYTVDNPYISFYSNDARTSLLRTNAYNGSLIANSTIMDITLDQGTNYIRVCSDTCWSDDTHNYSSHGVDDKYFYYGSQNGGTFDNTSRNGQATTELTTVQYTYIEEDDSNYIQYDNAYAKWYHSYMYIDDWEYSVHNISWEWVARSETAITYELYIWNSTANKYEFLDNSSLTSWNTIQGYKNENCNHYVDSNGIIDTMMFIPDPGEQPRYFDIDYVKMRVLTNVTDETLSWEITKESSVNISTHYNETIIDIHNGTIELKMWFNATANYTNPQIITAMPKVGTHNNTVLAVYEGLLNITELIPKTYSDDENIYINATDIMNGQSRYYFIKYVYRDNIAPEIKAIAEQYSYLQIKYTHVVKGTDADPEDQLTYTLLVKPSGMTINETSGLISWTPQVEGRYKVTVQADDGIDQTTETFYINSKYSLFKIGFANFKEYLFTGSAMLAILIAIMRFVIVPLVFTKEDVADAKDAVKESVE